jgi:hypothetical protein
MDFNSMECLRLANAGSLLLLCRRELRLLLTFSQDLRDSGPLDRCRTELFLAEMLRMTPESGVFSLMRRSHSMQELRVVVAWREAPVTQNRANALRMT